MDLKKSFEGMKNKIGDQLAHRVQKIDLDSVLGAIGLQVVKHHRSMALPLIAAFGGGVAVGLLFAPMPGKELRAGIVQLVGKLRGRPSIEVDDGVREKTADGKDVASPYDTARSERESGGNGHKKSPRPVESSAPGPT